MIENPCTHPGDIRLLTAVDKPEFRYLTNVIVFPSTGERPLCNMMSGGDLDGDVYFVCWDERITNHINQSSIIPPAKYTKPDFIKEKPAEETIADYFIFYLERDVLGQLANLHLALCDQLGKNGPLSPICTELSGLQSIAVDFAKHGECVSRQQFSDIQRQLKSWPDFFEKTRKQMRESEGILGLLYRDLSNEQSYRDFMKNQYYAQVLFKWGLDKRILQKASNTLHSYLIPVYTQIVVPMEREIRTLMFTFRQHSEAALFASDLRFHISGSTTDDIQTTFKYMKPEQIGGSKPDEALAILNYKLHSMIEDFQGRLARLIGDKSLNDINAQINCCVALYFTSYFHMRNDNCRAYIAHCFDTKDNTISPFLQLWGEQENQRLKKIKDSHKERLLKSKFEDYFEETKRIEEKALTSPKTFQRLVEVKKLFSVPWLLAHDVLFHKQDFLRRVYGPARVAAASSQQTDDDVVMVDASSQQ